MKYLRFFAFKKEKISFIMLFLKFVMKTDVQPRNKKLKPLAMLMVMMLL